MFKSARIKLTSWYLLIIMVISISFSVVIYVSMCRELERGFRRAEIRRRAEELGIVLPRYFPARPEDLPLRLREVPTRFFLVEDIAETKNRLGMHLLMVNGAIFAISALAGFFLAGKTLKPIENALEEQKRFVADASHELRTPLTALKTSMEVVLRDKKRTFAEVKKVLEDNLEEIERLKLLSDKLLNLARYQSNGQNLVFKEVEIGSIVEKAVKKVSSMVKEKEIELKTMVENQRVSANEESLEEMLLIFLDNAVKYTPSGGKIILETESDKKWLMIKIRDTGMGIAKEDLPHIFDRFFRADQSRSKEKVAGFGLGLSLAKKIIEIHKGTVEVASTLGEGTTFTLKLPLRSASHLRGVTASHLR